MLKIANCKKKPMSDFFCAYQSTLQFEGIYSNDPRDLGGETFRGISRKNWPDWEGWLVVDAIKKAVDHRELNKQLSLDEELSEMVQEFYKVNFWKPLMLDQIPQQVIAAELFDTAVNQGAKRAVLFLQQALNLLNNNQKHYSDINEDGKMGMATLKAYAAYMLTANFPGRSIERNSKTLLKVLNGMQFSLYSSICENNPEQEAHFYGWVNRI